MWKVAFLIVGLFIPWLSFAQGFVLFSTRATVSDVLVLDAPVFKFLQPTRGPSPDWSVQLFQVIGDSKMPLYPSTFFRANGLGGTIAERYVWTRTNEVPGVPPGESATLIVRAWKTSFGSFEAAASAGYTGESLPVTVTLGTEEAPALLIGLKSFQVGPFSTNFTAALVATPRHPHSMMIESAAGGDQTIERSANLKDWDPVISLFNAAPTFYLSERSAGFAFSEVRDAAFFRVRYQEGRTVSLAEWREHAPRRYRFRFKYYRNDFAYSERADWSATVTVENNRVASVTEATLNGVPVMGPDYSPFKSVEELLGLIENSNANGDLMTVIYDPIHLFPRLIEINNAVYAGTEVGIRYEILNWEALPTSFL